ncbi:MAG: Glycosyl transferase [Parcubacteria group bacterium Gr01-1014_13]|nr:MAG: Glycosyl transferase [Parcubacteria group bacterium Gr01-1014_13]
MLRLKQLTLLTGDIMTLYIGLYFALYFRYLKIPGQNLQDLLSPMTQLFFLAAVILFIAGLYDISKTKNSWAFYQKIILSALAWTVLGIIYFYINPKTAITPKTILLLTAIIGFGLVSLWRFFYNKFISTTLKYNIIFAGVTAEVKELINNIQNNPRLGYLVLGVIGEQESSLPNIAYGKTIAEINNQTKNYANIIVLSPQMTADSNLLKELYQSLFQQVSIVNLSDFYETVMHRIPPFTFSENWFVANLHEQQKKIYDRFRILTDYILAVIIGIFFIVTFPIIALIIKLNSKGKIFFSQNRVGRQGLIFKVYKYRTMKTLAADGSAETGGPQYAADKDVRITTVGKILRRTRLDEIPQFINILKGQMSVIGPRPERPEFVQQLTEKMPYYSLRHLIKPGLTGWAQINNAYYGTIEENLQKLEYDLYYIKNRNFTLDISIILRTINTILRLAGR